jgi:hypothetical protein
MKYGNYAIISRSLDITIPLEFRRDIKNLTQSVFITATTRNIREQPFHTKEEKEIIVEDCLFHGIFVR